MCASPRAHTKPVGRNESNVGTMPAPLEGRSQCRPVPCASAVASRRRRVGAGAELEQTRWDPKDGELCLRRLKPGETLVEGRSDSDVQIDRRTLV